MTTGGLLVIQSIIHLVFSVSALTWLIRYHVIIIKTKVYVFINIIIIIITIKTIYTVINDGLLSNINIYKLVTSFNLK
jgi:hypothetical protein